MQGSDKTRVFPGVSLSDIYAQLAEKVLGGGIDFGDIGRMVDRGEMIDFGDPSEGEVFDAIRDWIGSSGKPPTTLVQDDGSRAFIRDYDTGREFDCR